mmetsp:Transcript_14606/g.45872  ORF Transcript_14606/g.45872 Transcript_14606/m.45872 type:complete len:218 (-) Transcript_14606:73-726(-)
MVTCAAATSVLSDTLETPPILKPLRAAAFVRSAIFARRGARFRCHAPPGPVCLCWERPGARTASRAREGSTSRMAGSRAAPPALTEPTRRTPGRATVRNASRAATARWWMGAWSGKRAPPAATTRKPAPPQSNRAFSALTAPRALTPERQRTLRVCLAAPAASHLGRATRPASGAHRVSTRARQERQAAYAARLASFAPRVRRSSCPRRATRGRTPT